MKLLFEKMSALITSAWVGGMWAIGYIAAPVLFYNLQDKTLAGMLAGKLFTVMAYVGIACAVYLIIYYLAMYGRHVLQLGKFWLVISILILTLVGQFGLQPILASLKSQALPLYVMDSPYADRFSMWHGISSIGFLIQSLLGAALLLKTYRARQ